MRRKLLDIKDAPKDGYPIQEIWIHVKGGCKFLCHWAYGGGEDQPSFGPGWFYKVGSGVHAYFQELDGKIVGWTHKEPRK